MSFTKFHVYIFISKCTSLLFSGLFESIKNSLTTHFPLTKDHSKVQDNICGLRVIFKFLPFLF